MTASGVSDYYDRYWEPRIGEERFAARSRARAEIALRLLGPRRGSLLEVGCGPGWALDRLQEAGFDASGVDISPQAVERARARGLDALVADVTREEIRGFFDVVAAFEVLEHLADPLALLRRMVGAVKPAGVLLVSLPNEFHVLRRLGCLFGRRRFGGHDDPHIRHFDPNSAFRLFQAAGLRVIRSGWDGLVPPRWGFLKRCTDPLAAVTPGLFAISGVHLLETGTTGQPTAPLGPSHGAEVDRAEKTALPGGQRRKEDGSP